jgi:2-methylcitrate dehydratase PrpD
MSISAPADVTGEGEPLTDIIVSFVTGTAADVPEAARGSAKPMILDAIGVSMAAASHPIGKIITRYALDAGGEATATIFGAGAKASPAMAALANGTMANALDFDPSGHLATHVLPAALATAEHNRLSGPDLLDAFVIGIEVGRKLTQAFDSHRVKEGGPTYRGWWHVGLVGPIAAAVTAARLLKLDSRQTAMAIGIASCSSGGFRRNMGTMAKALHSGNAARDGIQAAELAKRGFTADAAIIESPLGFMAAVGQPEERDYAAISERLGRPYFLESKLRLKPFPACSRGHPALDAALALRRRESFKGDEIEAIEADLKPFSLLRSEPDDVDAAGFSAAFMLAVALIFGTFGLDQLCQETIDDPRVRALMKRVKHVPAKNGAGKVTVRLSDGRVLSTDVEPIRKLSTLEEIEPKFHQCAGRVLARDAARELQDLILRLDGQPNIDRLMALAGARAD